MRAGERDVRRADAEAAQPLEVVGLAAAGGMEPFVVDPVRRDDDRRARARDRARSRSRGVLADRDDRTGPVRADAHHRREERDLAALVPLGMVEEREVVHGDDRGTVEAQRHRVVRAVPDVERRGGRPAPAPRTCSQTSRAGRRSGTSAWTAAFGASSAQRRRVVATGEEVEVELVVVGEAPDQLHRVDAGADGTVGHRRDVQQQAHEVESTSGRRRAPAATYASRWALRGRGPGEVRGPAPAAGREVGRGRPRRR